VVVRIPPEKTLMGAQGGLDLDVLRQDGDVVDAQTIRCLAFGLEKVLYAVLGHDAGGFLSQRSA
jgi:hypothetical protein